MNKYRFKGVKPRAFPFANPGFTASPGDVIERVDNPDSRWFELVAPPPETKKPTPSKRADEEKS